MIVEEYNRRSIRLKGFDYCSERYYFVTIVSKARENIFGKIVGARRDAPKMKLNKNGRIIREIWYTLPEHHEIELDEFVIMPNHVHMILKIVKSGILLGWLVGMFKTECTKRINRLNKIPGRRIFHRNYYERIIRNEKELEAIREYIRRNPENWACDSENV